MLILELNGLPLLYHNHYGTPSLHNRRFHLLVSHAKQRECLPGFNYACYANYGTPDQSLSSKICHKSRVGATTRLWF